MTLNEEREYRFDNAMHNYFAGNVPVFVNGKVNLLHIFCQRVDALTRVAENLAAEIEALENRSIFQTAWHRIQTWWLWRKQKAQDSARVRH